MQHSKEDLMQLLWSIDHRGYPAYKETKGKWSFGSYMLSIDHVQGDPFAAPSSVSIHVPGRTAQFPEDFYKERHRRIALQDHLLRLFYAELSARDRDRREDNRGDRRGRGGTGSGGNAGSGKSGLVTTSKPGQEILERMACRIDPADGSITVRFEIGFPANGRTINVKPLIDILDGLLPAAVSRALTYRRIDQSRAKAVLELADDQKALREALKPLDLCAFIADGSVLPRQSGISTLPMKGAVPFTSPESLAVTIDLPHRGKIRGMGIRKGVTLIVGGGYHGKSTLLQALELGVYDHIRGDGRELVVTDRSAVKVRAEDGRSITGTDISLFIRDLPSGKDTVRFSTEDASGSTSQAAAVMEALEAGTKLLLIDEDTCATNFMLRDALMANVVSRDKEPITPFLSRIRPLYEKENVSTILVAGSSGAFFYVADTVIQMDQYKPVEITQRAKKEAARFGAASEADYSHGEDFKIPAFDRRPLQNRALLREDRVKVKVLSRDGFLLARDELELRGLEQIADREQTAALAYALKYLQLHILDGKLTVQEAVSKLSQILEQKGLEELFDGSTVGNGLAEMRPQEIFGTLNRYRKLVLR